MLLAVLLFPLMLFFSWDSKHGRYLCIFLEMAEMGSSYWTLPEGLFWIWFGLFSECLPYLEEKGSDTCLAFSALFLKMLVNQGVFICGISMIW